MKALARPRALFSVAVVLAGCGAASTAPTMSDEERLAPARLYPMSEGSVWSYNVDTGDGDMALSITRVIRREGSRVEISANGQTPMLYEIRPEGIFRPSQEVWLLRGPIREQEQWPSAQGMTATVVSTAASAETNAGTFEGCVRVEEAGGAQQRTIRTTYCPEVGPVLVESTMQLDLARRPVGVIGRLLGYEIAPEGTGNSVPE